MKKIVKLTESQLKQVIENVILQEGKYSRHRSTIISKNAFDIIEEKYLNLIIDEFENQLRQYPNIDMETRRLVDDRISYYKKRKENLSRYKEEDKQWDIERRKHNIERIKDTIIKEK